MVVAIAGLGVEEAKPESRTGEEGQVLKAEGKGDSSLAVSSSMRGCVMGGLMGGTRREAMSASSTWGGRKSGAEYDLDLDEMRQKTSSSTPGPSARLDDPGGFCGGLKALMSFALPFARHFDSLVASSSPASSAASSDRGGTSETSEVREREKRRFMPGRRREPSLSDSPLEEGR